MDNFCTGRYSGTGSGTAGATPTDTTTASPTSEATAAPEGTVAEVIWRTEDVRPVSAPIVVEGAVVLYTRTGQELFVTAVDPTDGTELWSRPATSSQSIRGVGLHLRSVDWSVAHLAPDAEGGPGSPAFVVLQDPWTGEPLLTSEEAAGWTGIGPLGLSRLEGDGTQVGRVGVQGEVQWTVDGGRCSPPGTPPTPAGSSRRSRTNRCSPGQSACGRPVPTTG